MMPSPADLSAPYRFGMVLGSAILGIILGLVLTLVGTAFG